MEPFRVTKGLSKGFFQGSKEIPPHSGGEVEPGEGEDHLLQLYDNYSLFPDKAPRPRPMPQRRYAPLLPVRPHRLFAHHIHVPSR